MSAGEIADRFVLARSTLSGHFNILKNAGLIVAEKNGTTIVYSLNVSVVEQTMAAMLELLRETDQVLQIEVGVGPGAGITPPGGVDADRAHEGAEMQLA